jgi:hypothetical protein
MDLQKEQNKADKPYMFSEDKIFVKLGAWWTSVHIYIHEYMYIRDAL